jgi:hypothetical protein
MGHTASSGPPVQRVQIAQEGLLVLTLMIVERRWLPVA